MFTILLILHIIVAGLLVLSILLQSGQAGGLSGAFGGGGGSQTLFGGRGASTFLTKATAYLAAGFLVVSFLLAFVQTHRSTAQSVGGRNIIRQELAPSQEAAPPPAMPPGASGLPQAAPGDGAIPVPSTPGRDAGTSEPVPVPVPDTSPAGDPAGDD